jgi:hypothetical protein
MSTHDFAKPSCRWVGSPCPGFTQPPLSGYATDPFHPLSGLEPPQRGPQWGLGSSLMGLCCRRPPHRWQGPCNRCAPSAQRIAPEWSDETQNGGRRLPLLVHPGKSFSSRNVACPLLPLCPLIPAPPSGPSAARLPGKLKKAGRSSRAQYHAVGGPPLPPQRNPLQTNGAPWARGARSTGVPDGRPLCYNGLTQTGRKGTRETPGRSSAFGQRTRATERTTFASETPLCETVVARRACGAAHLLARGRPACQRSRAAGRLHAGKARPGR